MSKNRRERLPQKFWNRRGFTPTGPSNSLSKAGWAIRGAIIVGFTILLVVICFLGRSQPGPQVSLHQPAKTRVVADFDFQFASEVLTERIKQQRREEVSPVYTVETRPLERFEQSINRINANFQEAETGGLFLREEDGRFDPETVEQFIGQQLEEEGLDIPVAAMVEFLTTTSQTERSRFLQTAFSALRAIHRNGIVRADDPNFEATAGYQSVRIFIDGEGVTRFTVLRLTEARNDLRVRLGVPGISDRMANILFAIFSEGLTENLVFSREATRERRDRAAQQVEPVVVRIAEGETMIEPGQIAGPLEVEKIQQYRIHEDRLARDQFLLDPFLRERILLTILIVIISLLIARLLYPKSMEQPRRMALLGLVVLLNLVLIRLLLEIGDSTALIENPDLATALPFAAPFALAALTVTILLGPVPGTLSALLVSLLFGLMAGDTLTTFLAALTASLVGIYFCRDARLRSNVVKAALLTGASFALITVLFGLFDGTSLGLLYRQAIGPLVTGFLTGVLVLGLLPFFENTFRLTTDITLLEYTDFNHPLLRRMQLDAPGSYHHSLMVANLAENAAAAIGANPLLCRACSLFHDIGKLVKPEYFTENQQNGHNPLLDTNPSMSALIIKRHVKEGVELARQYRLPHVFVDIIQQHHGSTLIKYFYIEALNRKRQDKDLFLFPDLAKVEGENIDESTYRYDGPRPRFVESAIIFFADSVEAASRSLKKVNAQSVDELIDLIFQDRMDDRQLDLCPLTLEQIAIVKRVFSRTILNSLHARISYPAGENEAAESGEKRKLPADGKPAH